MPIVASDIKKYLSGGASNSDPNASLGGTISSTEVVDDSANNLFALAQAAESDAGSVKYRAIFIKNTHATLTYKNVKVYIDSNTPSGTTSVKIALADEVVGDNTIETIVNENTSPSGPVFSTADGYANGLAIGDIPAGDMKAVWIEYTIAAGTEAANDEFTIGVKGETEA